MYRFEAYNFTNKDILLESCSLPSLNSDRRNGHTMQCKVMINYTIQGDGKTLQRLQETRFDLYEV